ncbi:UPF0261 family protein [Nitratireductor mangrovi]|uniref:UPF0261 family protein n=1 Tax=Nitratireductor mangrovi TaxID=2599600 RepID=A0A5B8L539_9HYPH|nr:Tm-1-like ATP-binding domain-containing protein [Nitratireductor mangrovi]QDZ02843.1 UPF0261 family protein [Nitratireductor mangrovi]
MKRIYVVGTADTKGEELAFIATRILAEGTRVTLVDLGTGDPSPEANVPGAEFVPAAEVVAHGPAGASDDVASSDRGRAVAAMTEAFAAFVESRGDIGAMLGIGGGGGTAMVTAGMRALPIGVPKVMVSTLASGDVSPYVGVSDIVMMPSITDLAGLNRISRAVLDKAARAIVAMTQSPAVAGDGRPAVGLTMFGVTTPCVTAIVDQLKATRDCLVFHATGTGGRTMEKLADSGMLEGVLDVTTTEICDLLMGGVLAAGNDRLDVVARTRIPYVGSVGALDMVNFWAPDTVPPAYEGRNFYRHNPNVTLMRTTARECLRIGEWIGDKLNACEGPVRFFLPEKGVSSLDVEGAPFFDSEADAALFDAIDRSVEWNRDRRLIRLPLHINDPAFASALADAYLEITS